MKIKDLFGICFYYWYGSGGHQSIGKLPLSVQNTELINADGKWVSTIRNTNEFKLHRAFVDNWIVVPETESNNQTFTLKTNPTEQNFYFDEYFKLMKANGITNIWCASGCFDWYKPFLGSNSQRKSACYDPRLSPSDPAAWKDFAHLCKLIAQKYNDTGLVDYIQCLNEWDFRWNVARVITPEEYAVCFKQCYDAIRSVSQSQKIMAGCTLTPDMDTAIRFVNKLEQLYQDEGKSMPTDWVYTFNNYIRTESNNQGSGVGATAEEVDRYNVFFKPLNDFLTEKNIDGFACTESGWNTSPSTSVSAMKSKAPSLEGFSIEEAQGILMIRTTLILASLPKFKGITYYHCRDEYEAEPFTYMGVNRKDWTPKPARIIIQQFLNEYGNNEVKSFFRTGDTYHVILDNNNTLSWTDKTNIGTLTPMPKKTVMKHLEVKNNRLYLDNELFKIIEANSPETRLKECSIQELNELNSYGVNTIYATCFGKDGSVPVTPFINNDPNQGFDDNKVNRWLTYLEYWVYGFENKHICHLLLSEKETHYSLSEQKHKEMIDYLTNKFKSIEGYIIWDREELDQGKSDYINTFYSYLKQKAPYSIRAMHNNTNENPWAGFENSDLIQLLSLQEWQGNFDRRIRELTTNTQWAVYVSEVTGGFQPNDIQKTIDLWNAGGNKSSGIGFYIASKDQSPPTFHSQYKNLYLKVAELNKQIQQPIYGCTDPTALNYDPNATIDNNTCIYENQNDIMTIGYSTKADRTDFKELNSGDTIPTGTYYIEARNVKAPVFFTLEKDGVTLVKDKQENITPFDLDGGTPRNFTNGNYSLTVKDKTSQFRINFVVGTLLKTGTLSVTTSPIKSGIYINSKKEGTGSISLMLPVGDYTISYDAVDGYTTPDPQTIKITENSIISIEGIYEQIIHEEVYETNEPMVLQFTINEMSFMTKRGKVTLKYKPGV
ncbi:MAG: hypothetical protein KatS3mg002_1362 [Candidatus Woesearchaeota archaeon]|nr:MAG: hypothetical protein KatS3mg002_1362 [Candidatus Woesearchaeota archaeon]